MPPRAAYTLTERDRVYAARWITGQIRDRAIPETGWIAVDLQDVASVWAWASEHLSSDDIRRMRSAIRAARHSAGAGYYSRTITIGEDAHRMLALVAQAGGMTLSEAIERHLRAPFDLAVNARVEAEDAQRRSAGTNASS